MRRGWSLLLISFLALYFELALIRWIPTRLRLMAYFSNFILIAALLGLGIGMIIGKRRARSLHRFPVGLVCLVVAVVLLERNGLVFPLASEDNFLWNGLSRSESQGPVAYAALIAFFLLTCLIFVPLGQEIGLQLEHFRPIPGYSINIAGSLLGVLGFAFISYLEYAPTVWFAVAGALFLVYLWSAPPFAWPRLATTAALLCAGIVVVSLSHRIEPGRYFWSPYYEVRLEELVLPSGEVAGFNVAVNQDSHQQALDLSDDRPESGFLTERRKLYDLPYTLADAGDVLILGAGTGNDVAAALRAGATRVDAVEIDPVIAELGELHPEQPYADPRVHLHVDDARSFLEKDARTYDTIVFGFLDSHRLFSNMSSVRLDNYIYTRENMVNVRDHLRADGMLSLTFTVHERWIANRLFSLLEEVYGHQPTVYQGNEQAWGTTFLARRSGPVAPVGSVIGPGQFAAEILPASRIHSTWAYAPAGGFLDNAIFTGDAEIPTDDWPHLYMRSRQLPFNYLVVLLFVFMLAALLVRFNVRSTGLSHFENWNFLLLGVAFALLETKGITDIALLFGSTWITNSVVIASVLLMILVANVVVQRRPVPLAPVYVLLGATLLFNYWFQFHHLLDVSYEARLLLAGLQVSLPMFFAGIIFATHFSRAGDTSAALGANLIGAMAGGLLEYTSLLFGQQALFLAALLFYVLSLAVVVVASRARPNLLRLPDAISTRRAA